MWTKKKEETDWFDQSAFLPALAGWFNKGIAVFFVACIPSGVQLLISCMSDKRTLWQFSIAELSKNTWIGKSISQWAMFYRKALVITRG